ncbi:hypothetical protein BDY17DRAFT_116074 [Neohortaea acidophila]|uniref:Uncharacterized protein n=1 Tax=Neohortaea acidophila TaxID=245834 RepID=A0A6A6PVP6_9PEZI|nr:uncharacterized protein BDY17DRAFT_116074 [Neohortaea acidophila]KAF2483814.1 hypothetical protein BDY17DRAFT_116074 [Neohortaea acidophila]
MDRKLSSQGRCRPDYGIPSQSSQFHSAVESDGPRQRYPKRYNGLSRGEWLHHLGWTFQWRTQLRWDVFDLPHGWLHIQQERHHHRHRRRQRPHSHRRRDGLVEHRQLRGSAPEACGVVSWRGDNVEVLQSICGSFCRLSTILRPSRAVC